MNYDLVSLSFPCASEWGKRVKFSYINLHRLLGILNYEKVVKILQGCIICESTCDYIIAIFTLFWQDKSQVIMEI